MAAPTIAHKLRIPAFDGSSDPLQWLHRCNLCFDAWETVEDEKVWIASFKLKGSAYQWYYWVERNIGFPSWA